MKALILAGGYGTRLRPLTNTRPKHMLPIANRPHIEHVFDLLLRHGVSDVVLLTSYLSEAFESVLSRASKRGMDVATPLEQEPLGTAGAFKNAESLVGEETFLAFNGDVLSDINLSEVMRFHRARDAEATIVLTPVEDPSAYGVVPTEDDGRVLRFVEKPPKEEAPTNLINAGIYVFEPSILERIPPGRVWSAERQLFPDLIREGARLFATATSAYWMDIGTPQKFLQASLDALSGRYLTDAVTTTEAGAVVAGAGARVDASASVSCSCLGSNVTVGPGSTVCESVLLPGAAVAADAWVMGSILGEGASVGPGVRIEGRVLADGERIEIS